MNKRKILVSLIGLCLLFAVFTLMKTNAFKTKRPPKSDVTYTASVNYQTVKNEAVDRTVDITGRLIPKRSQDLYIEVGGQTLGNRGRFKPGIFFKKGALLIAVESTDSRANLTSQKSDFLKTLAAVIPELKVDFNAIYQTWHTYLVDFDVEKPMKPLPAVQSDKQRLFLTGRGIYAKYYAILNLRNKVEKYRLYAPFDGTLTDTMVDEGSVVRPGQKLGEFISSGRYEVETAVEQDAVDYIKLGQTLDMSIVNRPDSVTARAVRINDKIDPETQSVRVFFDAKGQNLRTGLYVSGTLQTVSMGSVATIPSEALIDSQTVFVINTDNKAKPRKVTIVFRLKGMVMVRGLADGEKVIVEKKPLSFENTAVKIQ